MKRHYRISVQYYIDKQNDTNDKPIDTNSYWVNDPTLTRLQEIIFDLYDEENFEYARRLEDFEISFIKYIQNNH